MVSMLGPVLEIHELVCQQTEKSVKFCAAAIQDGPQQGVHAAELHSDAAHWAYLPG